ncbi:MAG: hypothetical protein VKS61_03700 [Candidatus Sericytochromatia bacterium]|nr:hypothetical protein [Candidatus Sericytochromatia bacterium]
MSRGLAGLVALATGLAGCLPEPTASAPAAIRRPARPAASATPGLRAGVGPSPARGVSRPSAAHREVTGELRVDARHLLELGLGELVSNNGARAINFEAGRVVANHGGGVLSNGGAALRLLQASPGGKLPLLGEELPGAGLTVMAVDPLSGDRVSLGLDDGGLPVMALVTDGAGRFQAYLPPGERPILLMAGPGEAVDPRLHLTTLQGASGGPSTLDDDHATATQGIRRVTRIAWRRVLDRPPEEGTPSPLAAPEAEARWQRIQALQRRVRDSGLSSEARDALAERLADIVLSHVDPTRLVLDRSLMRVPYDGPDETTFEACVGVLREARETAVARCRTLAGEGLEPFGYLSARPWAQAASVGRAEPWRFKRPADLVTFMSEAYLFNPDLDFPEVSARILEVMADVGGNAAPLLRLEAAIRSIEAATDRVLYVEPTGALEAVEAAIEEALTRR